MFNSGFRGKRAGDNQGSINPQTNFVQNKYPVPTITSWSISGSDDDALDPAGGQTVLVNGGGFAAGCAVTVDGSTISPVTLVSPNQISFTSPAKAGGSYTLIVYNSTGGAAILVPGLTYSSVPTWTTSAGSIGSYYETTAIDETLVATSDSSITYSLASGSLPSGSTLYANGVITGTAPVDSSSTTYTFAVTATDAEDQDVTRTFTLTVNVDVVTWATPSSGATITLDGTAYSQALSATDAAGYSIASYTANALPTGLSLSTGTISGTPTVEGSTTTLLTATAATTGRSATNTITWVVSLGDIYWKYVTLLLSGSTPTTTFINDASLNNSQLTIAGDTVQNNFNPYQVGYYSNYFDGSGDSVTFPNSSNFAFGTGDFTIEFWVLTTSTGGGLVSQAASGGWSILIYASTIYWQSSYNATNLWNYSAATIIDNKWHHLAFSRVSGSTKFFIDGTLVATNADTTNYSATSGTISLAVDGNPAYLNGFISNFRIIKGTGLYTASFTKPTTPLTAVANTMLLTCQTNNLSDRSNNNLTATKVGDTLVSPAHPFAIPTTVAYNTLYSTYFDGTGDYLTTPTSITNLVNFPSGTDYTIECWVYPTVAVTNQEILGSYSGAVSGRWILRTASDGLTPNLYVYPTGEWTFTAGSGAMTLNTWNHIAMVRIGSTTKGYLNGVERLSTTTVMTLDGGSNSLYIGAAYSGRTPWNGNISNVRIVKGLGVYTGAFTVPTSPLTATQSSGTNIAAITGTSTTLLTCQNATLIDNSTNAYTITSAADARPIAVSPFTMTTSNTTVTSLGSAYFDGTGDYLTATNPAFAFGASNDFTAECWVYFTTLNANQSPGIICVANSSSSTGWQIYADSNNGWGVRSNVANVFSVSNPPKPNQWYHVAYVRKSGVHALYVNGVVNATSSSSYTWSDQVFYTGYAPIGQNVYGYVSNIRLTNGTALYTSNFLPSQTPLTPVTNTQLLTLQYNGGANNNGFLDQSSFSTVITKAGNVNQGTFSPYSQTGWSTYFVGTSSQYFTLPTAAATAFGGFNGNYTTIEFWAYQTTSSTSTTNEVIGTWAAVAANGRFYIEIGNGAASTGATSKVFFNWTTSTGTIDNVTTTAVVPVNQWVHIAIVVNATGSAGSHTVNIYVNGTGQSFTSRNFSSQTSTYDRLRLGGNGSSYFNGYLSNLRVVRGTTNIVGYTGSSISVPTLPFAPAAGTVLLTFQSNRFIDNSPNSIVMTPVSGPTPQAYSPFGGITSVPTSYSVYFDGSGDYLTVPGSSNFVLAADYTIEAWIYSSSTTWSIYSTGGSGASDQFSCDAGTLYWAYNIFGGGTSNFFTSSDINQWTHIAASRSSGTTKLFKNGVVMATSTTNESIGSTNTVNIGRRLDGVYYINGYISNFRIVKGTALYTGAFTPPTSPLTAVANTLLLTCQNATMIDNSTNYFTVTSVGDTRPRSFNPFGQTTTNNISYTPSVNAGSMYFDGSGDRLSSSGSTAFTMGTGAFTVEYWVYQTVNTSTYTQHCGTATTSNGFAYGTDGSLNIYLTTNTQGYSSTGTITLNQWNHVAWTRDGSGNVRGFLNGVIVYGPTSITTDITETNFGIGQTTSGTGYNFTGYLSDIKVTKGISLYTYNFYPPASSATATSTLAGNTYTARFLLSGSSSGILDYHGTNNLETVGNTQLASEDPYGGSYYSNYFDGTGDYLSSPYNAVLDMGTGDCTMECWFYIAASTPANTDGNREATLFSTIRSDGGALTQDYSLGINGNASTTGTGISFNQRTSGTNYSLTYTATITQGVWHHIAVSRTGNTLNLLYDGVRVAQNTNFTASITTATGGNPLKIGGLVYSAGYPQYLNGNISNVRLIKGTALYTGSTYTVPTSPLTAITNTAVLTCQSSSFKDNSTNGFTITRNGDTKVKSFNPFQQNTGKSIYFDGTGDYLYSPSTQSLVFSGDFTVECWVYLAAAATQYVLVLGSNTSYPGLRVGMTSTGVLTVAFSTTGSSATLNLNAGTITTPLNTWVHIAVTRSGTSVKTYTNGTVDQTGTMSGTLYSSAYNYVGAHYTGATWTYLTGYITDLRITNGYARYTTTFTPPTTPFKLN